MLMDLADHEGVPLPGPDEPDGGWNLPLCPGEFIRLSGDWLKGRYLAFLVSYEGLHQGIICLRCYTSEGDSPALYIRAGFASGQPAPLVVDLHHLDLRAGTLQQSPGRLKAVCQGRAIRIQDLHHIEVELLVSDLEQRCTISRPEVHTSHPPVRTPGRGLIDPLGQLTVRRWPGRSKVESSLVAQLQLEAQASNQSWPSTWTSYGGTQDISFEAHGFFGLQRLDGSWWLVDPTGGAFFSIGVARATDSQSAAIIPGTERWFEWLPSKDNGFNDCRREDATRGHPTALFSRANLRRAFGDGWRATWERMTDNRLRGWRFNTMGVHSAIAFAQRKKFPYLRELLEIPLTKVILARDLPDVFDPAFKQLAADYAAPLADTADDPYLIAFVLGLAPRWITDPEFLMEEVLQQEPGTHTRRAFVSFMQERYNDDVQAWLERWQVPLEQFSDLEHHCFEDPATELTHARTDLAAFTGHMIDTYLGILTDACRSVDGNHLNAGLRFRGLPGRTCQAALYHQDFITIDHRRLLPATERIDELSSATDKPIFITCHQAGSLDRGLMSSGPVAVASAPDRATAYRRFIEQAATRPNIIGCHYQDLIDQPGLGRHDGECGNTGLTDVCHTPYPEIIEAVTISNEQVYDIRQGLTGVYEQRVREMKSTAV